MSDTAANAPGWAPFFTRESWAWFVAAVAEALDARGLPHEIDAEHGCVRIELGGSAANVLGLSNLAQVCHARPREAWPGLVRHHFDVAFDAKDGATADELARDWARARHAVKLRLYHAEHVPDLPVVTWPVAERLVAMLTFDLPDTVISVRREDRETWPVSDDALFAQALDNVRGAGALAVGQASAGDGATIHVLEGGADFFAASHALFLERYLPGGAPRGAIVSIPHRHVVLFHPIFDVRAVTAIQAMIVTTMNMYAEGPGSISPDLYWWRPAREPRMLRLPCELGDAQLGGAAIRFEPPADLVEMLQNLPPAPGRS